MPSHALKDYEKNERKPRRGIGEGVGAQHNNELMIYLAGEWIEGRFFDTTSQARKDALVDTITAIAQRRPSYYRNHMYSDLVLFRMAYGLVFGYANDLLES